MSAYFIFHNRITDRAKMDAYLQAAFASLKPYEFELLAADENCAVIEGASDLPRTIVIKFTSRAEAERWYNSPEYGAIKPTRLQATDGYALLVDGYSA